MEQETPRCQVCGEPATSAARDVLRHEDYREAYVSFSPVGATKYGCDKHPGDSEEFTTQLPNTWLTELGRE